MSSWKLSSASAANNLPKKPLYFVSVDKGLLTYKDHSLILHVPEKAVRRFPIARIERIIANRFVKWSGNAIMAVLKHKIPITWVNSNMESVGHAMPKQIRSYDLNDTVATLVANDDWQELYANLLKSLRQLVLDLLFKDLVPEERFVDAGYQYLKKKFVYLGHYDVQLPNASRVVCESYVVKQLEMAELDLYYVGADGHVLSIANDLSELLWAMINLDVTNMIQGASYAHAYAVEKWLNANPYIVVKLLHHMRVKLLQNWYDDL